MESQASPYQKEITIPRIVMFIEQASFSNKYLHISFTSEQFRMITGVLMNMMPGMSNGSKHINTVPLKDVIVLPDDISSFQK